MKRPEHQLPIEDRRMLSRILADTRKEIHSDYERAPSQFRAFFLYLERELFNPELKIGKALSATNLRGNNYSPAFHRITGRRPLDYVRLHRISAAQKILRTTRVLHWQVSSIVGFSDPSVFSRTYKRILGHSPRDEPRNVPSTLLVRTEAHSHQKIVDPRLSEDTAEISVDRPPRAIPLDTFWTKIYKLDRTEIREFIIETNVNLDHFYFLMEKAKHEGRRDRRRGEDLGLAALDVLKLVEFRESKEFPDEKALGYASLANTCKLRFRLEKARAYFKLAERFLPGDSREKPLLFAQVYYLKSSLLWWQRDSEQAISLINRILPDVRAYAPYSLLARVLLLLGEIYDYTGHADWSLPLFREAVGLTEFIDDSYLVFSAHFNLAYYYTRSAMAKEASTEIENVCRLSRSISGEIVEPYVTWLQGSVARINHKYRKSETFFLEAKESFLNSGMDIYASLVALDLSLLYLDSNKPSKAFVTAISAIPSISRFGAHQEAIAALAILQEAEQLQRIDKRGIEQALHHLELARKDPTSNFLVRQSASSS